MSVRPSERPSLLTATGRIQEPTPFIIIVWLCSGLLSAWIVLAALFISAVDGSLLSRLELPLQPLEMTWKNPFGWGGVWSYHIIDEDHSRLDIGQRLGIGHKIFTWNDGYFYLSIEQSRKYKYRGSWWRSYLYFVYRICNSIRELLKRCWCLYRYCYVKWWTLNWNFEVWCKKDVVPNVILEAYWLCEALSDHAKLPGTNKM